LSDAFAAMDLSALMQFLVHWRNNLQHILSSDPDGFLDRQYPKLAGTIPDVFPNYKDLEYYFTPLTNFSVNSRHNGGLPSAHYEIESSQPCLAALTTFCEQHFGLEHEGLITRLCTIVWDGAAL
jgi:hypothetical protein